MTPPAAGGDQLASRLRDYRRLALHFISAEARPVCALLLLLMLLLHLAGESAFALLAQSPEQIHAGRWWQIFSGHFVHFSTHHLLLNLAALALIGALILGTISRRDLLLFILISAGALGLLLYWFNPEYAPYAGFSGILHGLLIFTLWHSPYYSCWVKAGALLIIAGKIIHEQSDYFSPTQLQADIGAAVAVDAHLYGALIGLAGALLLGLYRRGATIPTRAT